MTDWIFERAMEVAKKKVSKTFYVTEAMREAERKGFERGLLEAKKIVESQAQRFGDRKHFTKYTVSALEFAAGEIQDLIIHSNRLSEKVEAPNGRA